MATLLGAVSGERLVLLKLNTVRNTVVRQTQTNSTLGLSNGIHRLKTVDKLVVRESCVGHMRTAALPFAPAQWPAAKTVGEIKEKK